MHIRSDLTLPRRWPRHARSAIIHAISMAHVAYTAARTRAEHGSPSATQFETEPNWLTAGEPALRAPAIQGNSTFNTDSTCRRNSGTSSVAVSQTISQFSPKYSCTTTFRNETTFAHGVARCA